MTPQTFTRGELETIIEDVRGRYRTAVKMNDIPRAFAFRIQLEALVRLSESPVDHEGVYDLNEI